MTLIALKLAKEKGSISESVYRQHLYEIEQIPELVAQALESDAVIKKIADNMVMAQNALYLGRGVNFPVALEGALKLKEISYIHAEGYPAAEMKHGPIALIDVQMPVVVVAVNSNHYGALQGCISASLLLKLSLHLGQAFLVGCKVPGGA